MWADCHASQYIARYLKLMLEKKKKNIQFIIIKQIEYVQKLFELVKSFPSINHILTIIMVICQGRFFLRGIVV